MRETFSNRVPTSYPDHEQKIADVHRKFWCVKEETLALHRLKRWNSDTIQGCSLFHLVASISKGDPTKLMFRELSCYYEPCENGDYDNCDNIEHMGNSISIKIQPHNVRHVVAQMSQYGEGKDFVSYASQLHGDGIEMADVLLVGDKFAVPTEPNNTEDVQFYVLECQRRKFLVCSPFKCKWGCEFEVGEYAMAGRYFQKWGRAEKSYVFLDGSCIAYIPTNLVCHVKFTMLPAEHRVQGRDPVYYLGDLDKQFIIKKIRGQV